MRSTRVAAVTAAAALALSACGTTEPATSDDASSGSASASASSDPVTVTDSRGKQVTLEGPADDVVALEWSEAEILATLDVMPVGVADVEGYETWVGTAEPLDDDVEDVGTRAEPSIDSIVALEPDLVVMEAERGSALVKQIEEYVPVVTVLGSDTEDNIGQMKHNVELLAEATGTEDKGEQVLSDFDDALAEGRQQIADAGMADEKFAMADGWMEGSTVAIRMFGRGSLMSELAARMGLENAWQGKVDPMWGLGQTDVEGLSKLGDVQFFYSASEDDVFAEGLADNEIWRSQPFVRQGQVHKLDPGTWTFGGPASSELFIDQVVEALAS